MTAQPLQAPAAGVRVRPFRPAPTGRPSSTRPSSRRAGAGRPTGATWSTTGARSCQVAVPTVPPARRPVAPVGDGQLYWTRRGIMVLVLIVLAVVAVMGATVVGAFLSISNEPAGMASVAPGVAPLMAPAALQG